MKRASPESMGVVQCSQVGAGRGSVLSSSLCSHGPVRLASPANSKSEKTPQLPQCLYDCGESPAGVFPMDSRLSFRSPFCLRFPLNLRPWNSEPLKVTPSQQHLQIKENRD